MNSFGNTALITGAIGGITVFWNYIRGFFARIASIAIVTVEVRSEAGEALLNYFWKKYKPSRFGSRSFTGFDHYIRPKNRYGVVAFEFTGKALTFWNGWKPVFVSNASKESGGGSTTVTFIRGMFKIETLISDAVALYDEENHGHQVETERYYVKRVFGRPVAKNGEPNSQSESPDTVKSSSHGVSYSKSLRPLVWTDDELKSPTSKVPFNNLSYDKNVQDFEEEIRRWKKSEQWFKERGLTWRFGGGAFGPPGTGKTSFVRAISQDLDLPIHIYDLTTMSNEELVNFWRQSLSAAPCVVLFEDIDRIFDKDKNIKGSEHKAPLTLDCLLNCINGVQPADGILVMVTANDMSKVDPALGVADEKGNSTRPGRLDRIVYFGPLTEESRLKVAHRILAGHEELIPLVVKDGEGETGAQFESRCARVALEKYWGQPTHVEAKELSLTSTPNPEDQDEYGIVTGSSIDDFMKDINADD